LHRIDSSFVSAAEASSFQIGQRVQVQGSEAQYVVVSVEREAGRLGLLRLSPARIEADVPVALVRLSENGLHLVKGTEGQ
jgi:hypothetical protein